MQSDGKARELQQQVLSAAEEMRTLRSQLEQERRLHEEGNRQLTATLTEQQQQQDAARREADALRHALQAKESEIAALRNTLERAHQQLQVGTSSFIVFLRGQE